MSLIQARARAGAPSSPRSGALRSPMSMMCLWVVAGGALYQLKWSTLFTDLSASAWFLLVLVVCMFGILASTVRIPARDGAPAALSRPTVGVIVLYYCAAFAYNGGIPVLQVLQGASYDIYSFGIPGLHVLFLSLTGYYAVRGWDHYLATKDRSSLMAVLVMLALIALTANRSALSFMVFAGLFLLIRVKRIGPRGLLAIAAVALTYLVVFGQFGNARLSHQIAQSTGKVGSSSAIADVSGASDAFQATGLAPTWLWPYMYFTSPIANFNSAIETGGSEFCGERCDLAGLVVHQLIPDVVGSRLGTWLDIETFDKRKFLIAENLTASTTFGSAAGYAGSVGVLIVLTALAGLSLTAVRLLQGSDVQESGLAILGTLLFFSFFENMLAYSPLALQLVYVLIRARRAARSGAE